MRSRRRHNERRRSAQVPRAVGSGHALLRRRFEALAALWSVYVVTASRVAGTSYARKKSTSALALRNRCRDSSLTV
jgi:hypothetical protein